MCSSELHGIMLIKLVIVIKYFLIKAVEIAITVLPTCKNNKEKEKNSEIQGVFHNSQQGCHFIKEKIPTNFFFN